MRLTTAALALTLASVLFATQPLVAQELPASQSPAPTLKVYSREAVVDTTVTDKQGNPVHGLLKPDFSLKDNNKPQPIRGFHEYASVIPDNDRPLPKLPPNTYTNLQPPAPDGAVNILLLDFMNAGPILDPSIPYAANELASSVAAQKLIKEEAEKYVANMPRGTRVAVLGLSQNLRTIQGFTSDPTLLAAAINTIPYNIDGRAGSYEQFCAQGELRNRSTLEAFSQIAADVAHIEGKKNLIWLGVGTPSLTNAEARPKCLPDYSGPLLKTYALLTASQVSIYPIDIRGVVSVPNSMYSLSGELHTDIHSLAGKAYVDVLNKFLTKVAEEQLSMEAIAEATGGAAFYNSNDLSSLLGKAINKGANYYTLTYVPPTRDYDGSHHTIKVSVDNPDHPSLRLAYRNTYDAIDPTTIKPATALTLATTLPTGEDPQATMRLAMGRSMPVSTSILFDAQVQPSTEPAHANDPAIFGVLDVKFKTKPLTRYGVEFAFPARQIAFTSGPNNTHHGALEFDIAAFDSEGHLINSLSQTMQLPLSDSAFQQMQSGPFRFFQQLDLPPGQAFLRIGIHDLTSNKIGTLEIPLTVPKTPPDRAATQPNPPTK